MLDRMTDGAIPCTAAVDFFIAYEMPGHVVRCLEHNTLAGDYVLELPLPKEDADLAERITRAQDMARTALAKRFAIESISEMGLGLA
ncbi:hypothetical protein [Candidatus Methylomirabilis sp.]|uniref:hypothetical protein n=1 Tax=Candidatus Methylomirabilis sp. TaxID=2032687 RepID=UPI003C72E5DC